MAGQIIEAYKTSFIDVKLFVIIHVLFMIFSLIAVFMSSRIIYMLILLACVKTLSENFWYKDATIAIIELNGRGEGA